METGDSVRVRQLPLPNPWVEATVDLVSGNQESLALSSEGGLGTEAGFGFNIRTGRQQLILLKSGEFYQDLMTEILWEVAS